MSHSLLHSPQFFQDRHVDGVRIKTLHFRTSDLESSDRTRVRRNEIVLKLLKKLVNHSDSQQSEVES
jgi:hypothetical protein